MKTILKDGGIEDSSVVTPEYVVSLLKTRLAELRVSKNDTNKFPRDTTWFVVCGYDSLSTPLLYSFGVNPTKRDTLSETETESDMKVVNTTAPYCYVAGEQGIYKRLTTGRHIPLDKMTLQIATRYAVFLLTTTIEMQQYDADAVPHVGGPIDVGVVTPNGFVWIQKKTKSITFEKR